MSVRVYFPSIGKRNWPDLKFGIGVKIKAWWNNTTEYCLIHGHMIKTVDGNKRELAHQKGGARPSMQFFSGVYEYCTRDLCEWNRYTGPTTPYKTVVMIPEL